MAKSGAGRNAGSTAAQRNNQESNIISKYLILPIIASVVVSLIVTNLNSPSSIPASAAHTFLEGYFNKVTHPAQRNSLYQNDLTSNFRSYPGVNRTSYIAFWEKWESVDVNLVIPVPGNPLEFAVTLTYQPTQGNAFQDNVNFWLVCTGIIGKLQTHVPIFGSCPTGDIKIDNEQLANPRQ